MRSAVVFAFVAAALAAAAPAVAKPATGNWELRTFRVKTTYHIPPGSMGLPDCGLPGDTPLCWMTLSGVGEVMEGTFAATGHWDARVWKSTQTLDGDLSFDGVNYMTGTIRHCGSGSFEYHDHQGTLFTSNPDPDSMGIPARNTWSIPRSSLRGELAERLVSAGGEQNWHSYPLNQDPEEKNWGTGEITGHVTCWVPARKLRSRRAR